MQCAITPITNRARNEPTQCWRFNMALNDSAEVMETVAKKRFLRKSPFLEFCDAEGTCVNKSLGGGAPPPLPVNPGEPPGRPRRILSSRRLAGIRRLHGRRDPARKKSKTASGAMSQKIIFRRF